MSETQVMLEKLERVPYRKKSSTHDFTDSQIFKQIGGFTECFDESSRHIPRKLHGLFFKFSNRALFFGLTTHDPNDFMAKCLAKVPYMYGLPPYFKTKEPPR